MVSIRSSLPLGTLDHRVLLEQELLWHGCIFSNLLMVRIMLAQRRILNFVSLSINQEKVQDIHREDCQWNLFMPKNMTELLTLMRVRSRFKTGAEQNAKP